MEIKKGSKPLTKKYLVKIADTIKKYEPVDIRLVNELMDIFEDMNPYFNRGIFLKAVTTKKDYHHIDMKVRQRSISGAFKTKVKEYKDYVVFKTTIHNDYEVWNYTYKTPSIWLCGILENLDDAETFIDNLIYKGGN